MALVLLCILICNFAVDVGAEDPYYLSLDYYSSTCPDVLGIVRAEMECAVLSDPRNAAAILRLHFHDCFVQGCDGSVLLDDTITLQGERRPGRIIKNKLESECPGVVSCADLLTIAARDAVILVGGPYWDVPLGRKDSKTASPSLADANIPAADEGIPALVSKFLYQGLSVTDLVALSGAHTIGVARCQNFRDRIYGDFQLTAGSNPLSDAQLNKLRSICPAAAGESDDNITALDYHTPYLFDNSYYQLLLSGEGLLNSDQELYSGMLGWFQTKELVQKYAEDSFAFFQQFSDSMVKMGNITNLDSFTNGERVEETITTESLLVDKNIGIITHIATSQYIYSKALDVSHGTLDAGHHYWHWAAASAAIAQVGFFLGLPL
ncbi:Peroxidase 11 [Asimina triloba]